MRIIIGTVVMLIIAVALGSVLNLHVIAAASATYASPQFAAALLGLFAATCGGLIARKAYFAAIAIAAYTPLWALSIYHVHRFRLDLTYVDLVASNAIPIAISLAAVGTGSLFGHNLSRVGRARRAAA